MVKTGPSFSNGGGVGQHADGTLNFSEVTTRDDSGGLVVDTDFETSGAPVNELNSTFGFDGTNSSIDILGDDITTVKQAASHVFAVTGVTFNHLVGGFEARVGDFSNSQLFVVSFLGRDDGGISDEGEVDTGVGDQIGLELSQIDVEGTIETERSSDRRDNLSNQTIQVGVGGAFDIEVAAADIVDSFVINHESTVRVFQSGVGGQDGVVGFNNSGRDLGSGVDGELEFGFLTVVDGETFQKESTETGTRTTTERVEDQET